MILRLNSNHLVFDSSVGLDASIVLKKEIADYIRDNPNIKYRIQPATTAESLRAQVELFVNYAGLAGSKLATGCNNLIDLLAKESECRLEFDNIDDLILFKLIYGG